MKNYKVEFLPSAKEDLRTSFLWGVNVWGKAQAGKWLKKMNAVCQKRLPQFPESCPLAPESKEFDVMLRQLVIDRYRVIFTIKKNTVKILYVRGAYLGTESADLEDEE